jgi:hypothetical protein
MQWGHVRQEVDLNWFSFAQQVHSIAQVFVFDYKLEVLLDDSVVLLGEI